jgi:hypothetical protein
MREQAERLEFERPGYFVMLVRVRQEIGVRR